MDVYCDSSLTEFCVTVPGGPEILTFVEAHRGTVTVNEGEYIAVIEAILLISSLEITKDVPKVSLFTDSRLVVTQVKGNAKCNFPHLRRLRDKVRAGLKITNSSLTWVSREDNPAGWKLEEIAKKRKGRARRKASPTK